MIEKHHKLLTHFVWNFVENHQVEWDKGEVREPSMRFTKRKWSRQNTTDRGKIEEEKRHGSR